MKPLEIRLATDRRSLDIDWSDGVTTRLSANWLRANCLSARATRQRIDGAVKAVPVGLSIREVKPVGHYAVNLTFSDGHDRGIYPWPYLRDLGRTGETSTEPPLGD